MAELRDDALARHLQARERQYELDEITLEYATDMDEGRAPRVEDFARRYPAFEREIAEFALYYATVGKADHEDDTGPTGPSRVPAAERALNRIAASIPTATVPGPHTAHLDGLTRQGARVGFPAPLLAERVGLSPDVLAKLEARRIEAATVPDALVRRLAATLHVSPTAITSFLSRPATRRGGAAPRASVPRQRAREPFLEAVRASALTPAQKDEWARIAADEGPGTA